MVGHVLQEHGQVPAAGIKPRPCASDRRVAACGGRSETGSARQITCSMAVMRRGECACVCK